MITSEHFHCPKINPQTHLARVPPPSSLQQLYLSTSMDLPLLNASHKWGQTIRPSVSELKMHVFKVHLSCSICQNFIPIYGWKYSTTCIHNLFIHLSRDGQLGHFHLLAATNCTAMLQRFTQQVKPSKARFHPGPLDDIWGCAAFLVNLSL